MQENDCTAEQIVEWAKGNEIGLTAASLQPEHEEAVKLGIGTAVLHQLGQSELYDENGKRVVYIRAHMT
jgi:hypothetical protein